MDLNTSPVFVDQNQDGNQLATMVKQMCSLCKGVCFQKSKQAAERIQSRFKLKKNALLG